MTTRKGERTFNAGRTMLPGYIALNARWHRDKPAIIAGERTRTWGEIEAATNRVANALIGMGLAHGDRVGLVMANSIEMIEIMLGVLKAGMVIAPINLTVPDEAMIRMLEDASARAVFVSAEQCERLEGRLGGQMGANAVIVGGERSGWIAYESLIEPASADNPGIAIDPDDWLHVMYSSGTTGLPKGIVHTHGNRMRWVYDLSLHYRYHPDARILISVGLFSNFSWAPLQVAVMLGATVVMMNEFTPRGFLETVQKHRVTHAAMVPVQYQLILADPEQENYDLSSLESLICGGSPLHADLQKAMFARFPCGFFEMYGTTEGAMTVISPWEKKLHPDAVGRPFQGGDIRIIDRDGKELPPGEAGEIVTMTAHLMEGYLNRPKANAEAVWKGPDGRNWLRTGDVGLIDENGLLHVLDRIKDMIVSGAQNIFPADIEAVVNQHPDVIFATVIGVAHPKWGETPLAIVTPRAEGEADEETITAWTNERVGKRQRIVGTVFTDDIPRNPNGKVLKRFLRERYGDYVTGRGNG